MSGLCQWAFALAPVPGVTASVVELLSLGVHDGSSSHCIHGESWTFLSTKLLIFA